ncbi:hypothetical protein D3C85_1328120 [compost metagenome]
MYKIILSKIWQIGKKLNAVLLPGSNGILGALSKTFETMFLCESITPLGLPVVPEV